MMEKVIFISMIAKAFYIPCSRIPDFGRFGKRWTNSEKLIN